MVSLATPLTYCLYVAVAEAEALDLEEDLLLSFHAEFSDSEVTVELVHTADDPV